MMKKQFKKIAAFITVGVLIVCAVFICACTESEVDPLPSEPPPQEQPIQTEYAEGELVIIEDGTTKIEDSIFWRNNKIRKVVMPDSVIEIGDYAFYKCKNLEEVVFSKNLEKIGASAFEDCEKLKDIRLPSTVTTIGERAFKGCSSLAKITIPQGVAKIDSYVFWECHSLTEIIIPNGITEISAYTFRNCESLETIELPQGLKSIGSYAFYGCRNLSKLDIPESVETFGRDVFGCCTSLSTLKLSENAKIDDFGFIGGSGVEYLVLPNRCSLYYDMFENCNKLRKVVLPKYIPCFEKGAFKDSPLEELYYRGSKEDWKNSGIDVICGSLGTAHTRFYSEEWQDYICDYWNYTKDGCISTVIIDFSRYCSKDSALVIPDGAVNIPKIYYLPNRNNIHKIIMPDSVVFIGDSCFEGMDNLKEVKLSKNLRKIPKRLFDRCMSLNEITIPDNITEIGDYAFYRCESLTEIVLPECVVEIGNNAFERCTNLTKINFPVGLKKIGRGAFARSGLTKVVLPDSIESIDGERQFNISPNYGTFAYCENLTELIIPEKTVVRNIDTFKGCTSLKKLTLPNGFPITNEIFQSLTSLEEISLPLMIFNYEPDAFKDCPLKKVYYRGTRTDWKEHGKEDICGKNGAPDILFYSEVHPGVRLNEYWHYVDGVPVAWD